MLVYDWRRSSHGLHQINVSTLCVLGFTSGLAMKLSPLKEWKDLEDTGDRHSPLKDAAGIFTHSGDKAVFSQEAGEPAFLGSDRWVSGSVSHSVGNSL